jgi:hypothetical protein
MRELGSFRRVRWERGSRCQFMCVRTAMAPSFGGFTIGQIGGISGACPRRSPCQQRPTRDQIIGRLVLENFTHWSVTFQNRSDDTRHYPDRNRADVMGAAAEHSSVMMMALRSSYIETMMCLACVSEYDEKRDREGGPILRFGTTDADNSGTHRLML